MKRRLVAGTIWTNNTRCRKTEHQNWFICIVPLVWIGWIIPAIVKDIGQDEADIGG